MPFADYADLWLGGLQIRPSTMAQYRSNLHPKVDQERLGHVSIVETMDTCSHLFPQAHAETAAALDQHLAAIAQPRLRAV